MLLILLFLLIGIVQDYLITLHYRCISESRPIAASVLSFVILLVSVMVIEKIIQRQEISLVISYAFGSAIGTYIAMKMKKFERK